MSRFSLEKIRRAGVFWYIRHRVHRTRFERTADEDKRKHERGDLSLQLQNAEREGDVPQRHAATRRSDCARDLSQPRRNLHRLREEDEDRRKGLRQGLRRAEDGGEDRENRSAGGREGRHTIPSDVVFVIREREHPSFARDEKNNLIYKVNISLREALTGCNIQIPLLCGESLNLSTDDVVSHGTCKRIPGKGMPRRGECPGDLLVHFSVAFPEELTEQQKDAISTILPD